MAIFTQTRSQLAPYDIPASSEFFNTTKMIRTWLTRYYEDESTRFAGSVVPIWVMRAPTPEMVKAGGCIGCRYLGLWAQEWPGFEESVHGHIWLFEDGIRSYAADQGVRLEDQVAGTMIHEVGHALGRNHVLDEMRQAKAAGMWPLAYGQEYVPAPCG